MNITDKLYTEWAWRSKTGTPTMDNPEDKAILDSLIAELITEEEKDVNVISDEELAQLISSIKNDKEAMQHIVKYIKNRPLQNSFFKTTAAADITDSTIEGLNAPQKIFNILADNDDLEAFNRYVNQGQLSFSDLGNQGNLVDKLSQSGISKKSVQELMSIGGYEGGRGVGKAEVALALLLKDIKMMTGDKGDLSWNGKYLEVKGIGGRLGSRNTTIPDTLPLIQKKNSFPELENNIRPDLFIASLSEKEDSGDLLNQVEQFASKLYPNGEANKYFTKDILDDPKELRKAFIKTYFRNYINKEGVKHFIFIDTKLGGYFSVAIENIDNLIDFKPTISSPITVNEPAPNIFKSGIKHE